MSTEVTDAERDLARTKQRFEESLRLAADTGGRLATEIRRKATPTLLLAAVVGGAAMAGTAFMLARREPRRHRRGSNSDSLAGTLVRTVGIWLLRAAALRLAEALAEKFRAPTPPALAARSEP